MKKIIAILLLATITSHAQTLLAKFKSAPDRKTISALAECYPGKESEIQKWFAGGETGFTFDAKNPKADQAIKAAKAAGGVVTDCNHPSKKY